MRRTLGVDDALSDGHVILGAKGTVGFAHRGGAALFPENTMDAFRGCLAMGSLALELDVHLTRDGHLVAFHDAHVERTTDGRGPIASMSLAECQRLDAGYWFTKDGSTYPFRGRGVTIPTLEAVAQAFPGVGLNVELKVPNAASTMLSVISRHRLQKRIIVAAHAHRVMADFRKRAGRDVATSASRHEVLSFRLRSAWGGPLGVPHYRALQVPPRVSQLRLITKRTIRHAHEHGVKVHAWTINTPESMRDLVALGVDGIMTDRPDVLLRVLGADQSGSSPGGTR